MPVKKKHASTKDPYYPWHPRDALADWELLSADAELAARRLLDFQWLSIALPASPTMLSRLVRKLTPARWRKAWKEIEGLFPVMEGDPNSRQNKRLQRERERMLDIREKRQRARRGGENDAEFDRGVSPQTDDKPPTKRDQKPRIPYPEPEPEVTTGSRARRKRPASAGADAPPNWVARCVDRWRLSAGEPNPGRLGKALKPVAT